MRKPIGRPHTEYRFGDFRFIPGRQLLLHQGDPIRLGSRAMELLHLLVERAGVVVTKGELKDYVWPDRHLHESNLKVNISALRRALAQDKSLPDFIATLPGRGYRFVAPVQIVEVSASHRLDGFRSHSGELPAVPEVIGRDAVILDLEAKLLDAGFVTIVGPAGVGKTTIAVAAARGLAHLYQDGIRFVDLATIDDPQLIVPAIGLAIGIDAKLSDGLTGLVDAVRGREMLLVLDNCEHVVSGVSILAEHLRRLVSRLHILATSREAIRSRSETVLRLAPLPCPEPDQPLTAEDAMTYPAVQLFVRRAEEAHGYLFTDADAPVVADICRRLDGIALALELAAPKLADSDPATLLALLEQSFEPLNLGSSIANPRHQTLLATLGWSYRLLSRNDAHLFRRLSVFTGTFTIEDILGIAVNAGSAAVDVAASTDSLVGKSLLSVSYRQGSPRYRLLDSTRSFAAAELLAHVEFDAAYARFARYFLEVLQRSEIEWVWRDRKDWTASYSTHANDVRKAIDWAFNSNGDAELGIRLTVAAIPLWDELSTVGESHIRVERALNKWEESGLGDPILKMKLMVSYGAALNFSDHLGPETDAVWDEGYELASAVGDVDYQLRTLWGEAVLQSFTGRHQLALVTLDRFMDLAERENDRAAIPDGMRLSLMTRFYLGEIRCAEKGLQALDREHMAVATQSRVARFQVDRIVGIRVGLAKITWIRGDHGRAMEIAQSALDRAEELGHRVSQSNALAQIGLPLALQIGDTEAARRHVSTLAYNLSLHETMIWAPVCSFYQGAIASAEGDPAAVDQMAEAIDELQRNNFLIRVPIYLTMFAETAMQFGLDARARRAVEHAAELVERQAEKWCLPEVQRVGGLLEWRAGNIIGAEQAFLRSAEEAAKTGALTLQLRAVTSLAELLMESGRRVEAAVQLAPVYTLFDPIFPSKDIRRASRLLKDLTGGIS